MFSTVVLAIGFLLLGEGLAYALFPVAMKRALSVILSLPVDKIRSVGLITALLGAVFVWFSVK